MRVEIDCFEGASTGMLDSNGYWSGVLSPEQLQETLATLKRPYKYKVNDGDWIKATPDQEYETGAKRGAVMGRGRYDLISSRFLRRLAIHLETGAIHYTPRNWEKGLPLARTFNSMIRHSFLWLVCDRSEDHLAAVACNIMFLIHTEEMISEGLLPLKLLDELPGGHDAQC